ncbi:hypothetical protein DPMN_035901 [Dreissena polymorpha]|uniref:Uncharacterized protein n=1 Tax=Dreissena polymorpha TaxID=45954 RepID=A0A9D4MCP8_DREPO|nr:hypothetical protein DPMN_035901 [Dreissena polymorpha]
MIGPILVCPTQQLYQEITTSTPDWISTVARQVVLSSSSVTESVHTTWPWINMSSRDHHMIVGRLTVEYRWRIQEPTTLLLL